MWIKFLILAVNALLQLENHRAGGVYQRNSVPAGGIIGRWRFTVGTQQDLGSVQRTELFVVDCLESHVLKPFTLYSVVHYVTQTIEFVAAAQLLFGLADGREHTETES